MSYPITVLLDRLQAQLADDRTSLIRHLDRIEAKLDQKADQSSVDSLDRRVGILELSEAARKSQAATVKEQAMVSRDWRRWLGPTLLTAAMLTLMAVQLIRYGK